MKICLYSSVCHTLVSFTCMCCDLLRNMKMYFVFVFSWMEDLFSGKKLQRPRGPCLESSPCWLPFKLSSPSLKKPSFLGISSSLSSKG